MTREDQIAFVTKLSAAIAASLAKAIEEGNVPEDWDGHELRELLADTFARERGGLLKDHRSKRYREYEQVALQLPRF